MDLFLDFFDIKNDINSRLNMLKYTPLGYIIQSVKEEN